MSQETTTEAEAGQPKPGEEAGFGAAFAERANDPQRDEARTLEAEEEESTSATEEPAATARTEEVPSKEATTADTSGTNASAFDPWAGLTPEQKSHFERLQASERSQRGRVGALTKKLQSTSAAPPARQEQAPKAEGEQTTEQTTDSGEAATATSLEERLNKVVDEYGDVVGPIAEVLQDVRAEIATLKKGATLAEVDADAEVLTEAYKALEEAHSDFAELAVDQNFNAWLADQPEKVIELANSFNPREVSLALTLFKTERSAAMASQSGHDGEPGNKESTAPDAKRERQLDGSREVTKRGAPAAAGVPNEFGSAFKARAQATAQ